MTGRRSTGAPTDGGGGDGGGGDGGADPGPGAGRAPGGGPSPGDVVVGVRLSAVVGRGGAGTVWAGTEVASGARVAVKLLDRPAAGREALLLDGVRHPHVLALRRVEADPPALVMDLAAGGSLAAQVAARGTLEPGEVVTVLAPLADCLGALHARGVVHGDVSATNVLFVDAGRPVLADLGVAGLAGDGAAWATPGYAAPEVVAGARPGPAADVHGLGAAAWLALTGTPLPLPEDRLPLALLAPGCPTALAAAVTAAVDPDPAARPGPTELAATARAACPGLSVRLVPGAALGVRPDEAVTYRVREAAAADPPEGPARWWQRLDAAGGRALGPLVAGAGARRRALTGTAAAVGAAAVVAVLVVGLGGAGVPSALPGPDDGTDRPVVAGDGPPAPVPSADRETAAPPVPGAAAGPGTVATVPATPVAGPSPAAPAVDGPADLRGTVVALVAARERALRSGDPDALVQVHDPEGATLREDQELLRGGPVDVGYEVLDVAAVDGRPAIARVSLRTSAEGRTTTEDVVLELAAGRDGWRVRGVGR